MRGREITGPLPGGGVGYRVSRPGFDVTTEPFGSKNIAFDSRYSDLGTVAAQGQCSLNQVVGFPAMPYLPIAMFYRIDPRFIDVNVWTSVLFASSTVGHTFCPYVGIVSINSFQVIAFSNPYYSQGLAGLASFAYSIFAVRT